MDQDMLADALGDYMRDLRDWKRSDVTRMYAAEQYAHLLAFVQGQNRLDNLDEIQALVTRHVREIFLPVAEGGPKNRNEDLRLKAMHYGTSALCQIAHRFAEMRQVMTNPTLVSLFADTSPLALHTRRAQQLLVTQGIEPCLDRLTGIAENIINPYKIRSQALTDVTRLLAAATECEYGIDAGPYRVRVDAIYNAATHPEVVKATLVFSHRIGSGQRLG